jgi:hypothetical protein
MEVSGQIYSRLLYTRDKKLKTFKKSLSGLQGQSRRFGGNKISCPYKDSNPIAPAPSLLTV